MKTGEGEEGRDEESSEKTYNVVDAGAFSVVLNVCMYVSFRSYEQDLLVTPTFLLDKNLEYYYYFNMRKHLYSRHLSSFT